MSVDSTPSRGAILVQDAAELLHLAQEAGQLGLFEWRVQIGTVRLSPKLMALYGLTEFDGRYDRWRECLFQEDVLRVTDEINNAFAEGARELHTEFRICRRDDNALRWIEARNIIAYDDRGRASRVVGINADVTERKRALVQLRAFTEVLEDRVKERTRELEAENEARLRAEALLRQAQKMEAVGQLTGGIAHDFNNLLTIVLGGLDMIGRQLQTMPTSAGTARIARARDMALQGAQRAVTLTNRLLAFSRQQPLAPKPIDVNKLLASMSDFLQRTLGETIALETVLAAGLWRTHADPHELENALLNITLNARDAVSGSGKVTIETANCYIDESYVSSLPEPVAPGQYVMIAVADTGVGMDKATVDKAFEPFFTTKEVGKGTGLGLSQVYGFVRQSSGNVKIYSELGEGTTVKIYLPRFRGVEEHESDDRSSAPAQMFGGAETILVIEDDEALRSFTVEVLTDFGYRVLDARNGPAALEILERETNVDLMFTDVVMPGGMNGRQAAAEATKRRPALKVLFTTGYTRNAIIHHGRLDADIELISKPYSPGELAKKIRVILDR
jgi:signal transduction histidine kinase